MVRVTNGFQRHKRHKKYRSQAKWFRLWRKNVYNQVRQALIKQWQHSYVGRKEKKRDFRRLWIERLSASLRNRWSKYSIFMHQMSEKNIQINRKVLSNIAVAFPEVFDKIFSEVHGK